MQHPFLSLTYYTYYIYMRMNMFVADIYKALYDGPDPAPVIDSLFHSQSQNSTQQLEIDRLKTELKQYDEEFQQLKNQDITIRRLEDQIADFRESIEDQVRGGSRITW
jgi:hypothetical protein